MGRYRRVDRSVSQKTWFASGRKQPVFGGKMEASIALLFCASGQSDKTGRFPSWSKKMRKFLFTFICLTLASVLWAEEEKPSTDSETKPYSETVIISADRAAEPLKDAGSSVTVITREEIEQRHEPFLLDLLRTVPGVYISQSGSPGKATSIFIRGAGSSQSLVMFDGVPINDSLNFVDLGTLTTTNIERIEIVKGPQSTLYGSDAMGGVINIITRSAGNLITAKGEGGSDSTANGSVRTGYGSDVNNIALEYNRYTTDGETTNDDYENSTFAANGHVQVTEWTNVGATYRKFDTDLGIPLNAGVSSPNRRQKTDAYLLLIPVKQKIQEWWNVEADYSIFDEEIHFMDPDDPFFGFSDSDSRTTTFNLINQLKIAKGHKILAGYEYEKVQITEITPFSELNDAEITNNAFYAQYQLSEWAPLTLTAGIRVDSNSAFGDDANPRLAVAYRVTDRVRIHGTVGTGFRAPRPAELLGPFGNPDLQSEEVTGWDFGIDYEILPSFLYASGTIFLNHFTNLIAFDLNTFRLANFEEVDTSGLELEARIQPIQNLSLIASYTYLDTENKITGEELLRRPRNSGGINIEYRFKRLMTNFNWNIVGERFDVNDVTFSRTVDPGFNEADLVVSYDLIEALQVYGRITNIFDEQYQEVFGFPSPDRGFYAGVRLKY